MSDAQGIQDHDTMKLGLRPEDKSLPRLKLADYLTGTLPTVPPSENYLQGITFGLYDNDKFGVCGPTAAANSRRLVTTRLTGTMQSPSQDDVFDLYRRSGNPNFNPNTTPPTDDQGVNLQVMLQALVSGGIGGVKALGFAQVDVTNIAELKAAIAIFGDLIFGVNLLVPQQKQTNTGVWSYVPGRAWGGHAILGGAYGANPEGISVITWAETILMADSFIQKQLSEAWVVIWPEYLTNPAFLAGVNLAALAADYQTMTGQPFPAVVPVTPVTPVPVTPVPSVANILTIDLDNKVITHPSSWTTKNTFDII